MQRVFQLSTLALAFALSACGGDADETPDITEAIPLDPVEGAEANGGDIAPGEAMVGKDGSSNARPGAPSAQDRTLPGTMESGSNPSGITTPPKGSKVQRVN